MNGELILGLIPQMVEQSEKNLTSPPLLELRGISKHFGGTVALHPLDLTVKPGEVIGLIGENGAGKSTLIKLLSGVHQPDAGEIHLQGRSVRFRSPLDASRRGVATIHQELAYFERLTVAENLLLGEPWPRNRLGGTNWPQLFDLAGERLRKFELKIDPRAPFSTLSPAGRQEIAIVRALSQEARLLILDEPTAALTEPEVNRLMTHLEKMKGYGLTLIYVSHRLDEILDLTSRVVVLRDGARVADYPIREATVPRMVQDMVGRTLDLDLASKPSSKQNDVIFEASELSHETLFSGISFQLHRGEVLGLGGLVGAGRSELARCIFGLYPPASGTMRYKNKPWRPRNPSEALSGGVCYIPEERKKQGFVLDHSLGEGITIGLLPLLSRYGLLSPGLERSAVQAAIQQFSIRARSATQPIGTLSGGNQQKALLGRWLQSEPEMIILDEPTRGVDIGAKLEIHKCIRELASRGKAVLLISSDLPELLALSDRALVLHRGKVAAELLSEEMTQENVLFAASGFDRMEHRMATTGGLKGTPLSPNF